MGNKYLIFENQCPKCRFLSNLFKLFDIRGQFITLPIRSKEAVSLLHDFYEIIPYNYHYIVDDKDLCYTGLKAFPAIVAAVMMGIFWPFGSKGPHWLSKLRLRWIK